MGRTRITEEILEEVKALVSSGVSRADVVKKFKISKTAVTNIVNGKYKISSNYISKEQIAEVKSMVKKGFHKSDIALKVGISTYSVYRILKNTPTKPFKKPKFMNSVEVEGVRKDSAAGMKQKEIAAKYDVSQVIVSNILNGRYYIPKDNLTEEEISKIVEMIKEGKRQDVISKEMEVSIATVHKINRDVKSIKPFEEEGPNPNMARRVKDHSPQSIEVYERELLSDIEIAKRLSLKAELLLSEERYAVFNKTRSLCLLQNQK